MHPDTAEAADVRHYDKVAVADPYLEMHTGPGRGYPDFMSSTVATRSKSSCSAPTGTRSAHLIAASWAGSTAAQMELTLKPGRQRGRVSGKQRSKTSPTPNGSSACLAGDFGGANIISVYGGYSINPHVSIEAMGFTDFGKFFERLDGQC